MKFLWLALTVVLTLSCSLQKDDVEIWRDGSVRVVGSIDDVVVNKICESPSGFIWLATSYGAIRYDGTTFVRFTSTESEKSISSDLVLDMLMSSSGDLWLATQKGVDKYLYNSFKRYDLDSGQNYTTSVFEDGSGRMFATTRRGLFLYDEELDSFVKKVRFETINTMGVFCAGDGGLWVIRDEGADLYDSTFTFRREVRFPCAVSSLKEEGSSLYLYSCDEVLRMDKESGEITKALDAPRQNAPVVYTDRFGIVWEAPSTGGLVRKETRSELGMYSLVFNRMDGEDIISGPVGDGDRKWLLSSEKRIVTIDVKSGSVTETALPEVKFGNRNGIYYSRGRLFVIAGSEIFEYSTDGPAPRKLRCFHAGISSELYGLATDMKGVLLVCASNATVLVSPSLDELGSDKDVVMTPVVITPEKAPVSVIRALDLRNGDAAFSVSDYGIAIYDSSTGEFRIRELSDKYRQMFIGSLAEDSNGGIWAGTTDVGLFVYFRDGDIVREMENFKGQLVSTINTDMDDKVMVLSDAILYEFDLKNLEMRKVWKDIEDFPDYLSSIHVVDNSIYVRSHGHLYHTDDQSTENFAPYYGVLVASRGNVLRQYGYNQMKTRSARLKLDGGHDRVTLYVVCNSARVGVYNYSYALNGKWVDALNSPYIPLNDLSLGRNRVDFVMKTPLGRQMGEVCGLTIVVPRPFYQSIFAMIVYAALFMFLLALLYKSFRNLENQRLETEMERRDKQMHEQMYEDSMAFFSNISHEYRTPLTLISAAATELIKDGNLQSRHGREVSVIKRNSDRMLKLVSQMLDFSKLEKDALKLGVSFCDASVITDEVASVIRFGAEQKHMDFELSGASVPHFMWLDSDKYEKILYNLLTNSLKYTPEGGQIKLNMSAASPGDVVNSFGLQPTEVSDSQYLMVSVADTGVGIADDMKQKVFERFARVNMKTGIEGTGIGLYYTKSLVTLHHGFIKITDHFLPDGTPSSGTVLTFALPMEEKVYSEEEKRKPKEREKGYTIDEKSYQMDSVIQADQATQSQMPKILVIDDEYEVVYFLKTLLSAKYNVVSCYSALNGYKLIAEENPDIIISDVMMAEMDGLQLCRMVKENIDTCHIPVLLLTAKASVEDQIKGINTGADAYVAKPFDPEYLKALVANTLKNIEKQRKVFERSTGVHEVDKTEEVAPERISEMDKNLMEKLYALMEESISNSELNVQDMSVALGISRTKLYYKIKALTGKTPNEFFKIYKLNRAALLIKERKYKISAIADMVGFSSPSHFASAFKKQFGVLPKDYIE